MTKKMLNYKTNCYFDNLPYHNVIKYDMGSEQEVKKAYKDGYHECEKTLIKAKEIIKELVRVEYADYTNGDYSNELSKVLKQAEQFLKEIEK